jgi:Arc/MetJ-type ribon-helix-helix transcriptional regulator
MKKKVVIFRTTEQMVKDLQRLIDAGYYMDRTDALNDAIRLLREKWLMYNKFNKGGKK